MSGINWNRVRQDRVMRERGTEQLSFPTLPKKKRRRKKSMAPKPRAKRVPRTQASQSPEEYAATRAACRAYDGPPPWEV